MNDVVFSSASVEWETPQAFFDALNDEFHFTLDPCSTDNNAKCEKHYTRKDDGLSKDWTGETVFCNPPYGKEMPLWIAKCAEHGRTGGGCRYAHSSPNGHKGFSQVHIPQSGNPLYTGALEVWWRKEQRPVSFNGMRFQTN